MARNGHTRTRLLTTRTRWRSVAAAALTLTVMGGITAADATPRAQGSTELPPVTISSTTLRAGETISISGTGCIDPDSGTGEGLEVVLYVPIDAGRGGTGYRPTVRAAANADGTFDGAGIVDQPFFPTGTQTGYFVCHEEGGDATSPDFANREVQLTMEAPSLPDLTVAAGSTVGYELPCSIEGGEYGQFAIFGVAEGLTDISLVVPGSYPYDTSPQEGDQVQLQIPADASPGVYDATASCTVSESGTSAYFTGFTLTVTGETPAATPPTSPAAPATPATPAASTPAYTG